MTPSLWCIVGADSIAQQFSEAGSQPVLSLPADTNAPAVVTGVIRAVGSPNACVVVLAESCMQLGEIISATGFAAIVVLAPTDTSVNEAFIKLPVESRATDVSNAVGASATDANPQLAHEVPPPPEFDEPPYPNEESDWVDRQSLPRHDEPEESTQPDDHPNDPVITIPPPGEPVPPPAARAISDELPHEAQPVRSQTPAHPSSLSETEVSTSFDSDGLLHDPLLDQGMDEGDASADPAAGQAPTQPPAAPATPPAATEHMTPASEPAQPPTENMAAPAQPPPQAPSAFKFPMPPPSVSEPSNDVPEEPEIVPDDDPMATLFASYEEEANEPPPVQPSPAPQPVQPVPQPVQPQPVQPEPPPVQPAPQPAQQPPVQPAQQPPVQPAQQPPVQPAPQPPVQPAPQPPVQPAQQPPVQPAQQQPVQPEPQPVQQPPVQPEPPPVQPAPQPPVQPEPQPVQQPPVQPEPPPVQPAPQPPVQPVQPPVQPEPPPPVQPEPLPPPDLVRDKAQDRHPGHMGGTTIEEALFRPVRSYSGPRGSSVGVISAKGGVGKTTLTMWVAEAMNRRYKVCVIDANMDTPTIDYLTDCRGKTSGIAGLMGPTLPTDAQIDQALVTVDGLGHLLAAPQSRTHYKPSVVAHTLCHVIDYLRTRFEWVFVDLPVAGADTKMLTDFALKAGVLDLYMAVFNTLNSDNIAISTWFKEYAKPPERGGCDFDLRKCAGIINQSDESQLNHEWVRERIQSQLGIQIYGHVPDISGLGAAKNELRWKCPSAVRPHIVDFCFNAFGAELGANAPAEANTKTSWLRRRRKARSLG